MYTLENKNLFIEREEPFYGITKDRENFRFFLMNRGQVLMLSEKYESLDKLKKSIESLQYHVQNGRYALLNQRFKTYHYCLYSKFNKIIFSGFIFHSYHEMNENIQKIKECVNQENYEAVDLEIEEILDYESQNFSIDQSFEEDFFEIKLINEGNLFYFQLISERANELLFSSITFSNEEARSKNLEEFLHCLEHGFTEIVRDVCSLFYPKFYNSQGQLLFVGLEFDSRFLCQNNLIQLLKGKKKWLRAPLL